MLSKHYPLLQLHFTLTLPRCYLGNIPNYLYLRRGEKDSYFYAKTAPLGFKGLRNISGASGHNFYDKYLLRLFHRPCCRKNSGLDSSWQV